MKKKVFSLCLGIAIGLFLFFCFARIQNLFTGHTPSRILQSFEGTSGRNRIQTGTIVSGMDTDQLDHVARQLNISTGELQSALNSGTTIQELLQEQGINHTGTRLSPTNISGQNLSAEEILRSTNP